MKIRKLLIEERTKRGLSVRTAAKLCKFKTHVGLLSLEKCENDGKLDSWKNIQKAYGIKDKDMWALMTTYKYVENNKLKK